MDVQSMYHYLGYEFVPGPATMFQGIRKLPPGTIARIRGGQLEIEPYWELRFADAPDDAAPWPAGARDAPGLRARVDDVGRPEGVFLSGGLDSTAVLAFTREATTGPLPTFTLGYDDPTFSEWEYAREAARYYGTEHREIRVPPVTPDVIEQTVWHLDEPMTDLSAVPLFLLCREARRDVTVCMSGRAGTRSSSATTGSSRRRRTASTGCCRAPSGAASSSPWSPGFPIRSRRRGRSSSCAGSSRAPASTPARFTCAGSTSGPMRSTDASSGIPCSGRWTGTASRRSARAAARCNSDRQLDREVFVDTRFTMPDSVLMKVDKMSMAHALEIRVPLLDHHLIELAATIPPRLKFPGFKTRAIYRRALEGVLPPKILHRGKQGYSLPLKQWLRNELRDYTVQLLRGSEVVRQYLDPAGVEALIAEHLARRANHNHTLWALINLTLWHRRFIEGA
jgi:asparagine synthase (glutamine-hydrolysing)